MTKTLSSTNYIYLTSDSFSCKLNSQCLVKFNIEMDSISFFEIAIAKLVIGLLLYELKISTIYIYIYK